MGRLVRNERETPAVAPVLLCRGRGQPVGVRAQMQ